MFIDLDHDPRPPPPTSGSERDILVGFLRWHRATLELKCEGLGPDSLARRAIPPSTMSLLGLVRHMADVERGWFRRFMAGQDAEPRYYSADDPDGEFDGAVADQQVVDEAWLAWREEVDFADRFIAGAADLDLPSARTARDRGAMSLRWVLNHMIEEYARHNGHADLLREQIDGKLGQ